MRQSILLCTLLLVTACDNIPFAGKDDELKRLAETRIESLKGLLKDPASAQFEKLVLKDDTLCGRVNAKNGYGGYGGFRYFAVSDDQSVIRDEDGYIPIPGTMPYEDYLTAKAKHEQHLEMCGKESWRYKLDVKMVNGRVSDLTPDLTFGREVNCETSKIEIKKDHYFDEDKARYLKFCGTPSRP